MLWLAMRLSMSEILRGYALTMALLSFPLNGTPQSSANATSHFSFAYVQKDCGPTDGIVTDFYFTTKPSHGGKYKEPFLQGELNRSLPTNAPQSYSMKSGKTDVHAWRCRRAGSCETATSGFLNLSKLSRDQGVSGEYELHFGDGSVERGSFAAVWQSHYLLCG